MRPDLWFSSERQAQLQQVVVTAEQMRAIEERVFVAGMPVAALMEKVGGAIARRIQVLYPQDRAPRVGIVVGPGHNGGDAVVVARELHFQGYAVQVYRPLARLKELTACHARYAESLGIMFCDRAQDLEACDVLIDGLFGFGLTRPITGDLAAAVDRLNQCGRPIVSIDLPSGLHTDTGEVLGTAIRATHSLCLGLWKAAFLQDRALDYVGTAELIDFDLPLADVLAVPTSLRRITPMVALAALPLPRPATTHKYQQGHLLLVCGSRRYAGAAILAGMGARASGVGMLSIAVPESLQSLLVAQLPEALVLPCPETPMGAISALPDDTDPNAYTVIACGPGLTLDARIVVETVLASDRPLVLDADGLNLLAAQGAVTTLCQRQSFTVLTPHPGEFRRLFPHLAEQLDDRVLAARTAAQESGAAIALKGAKVAIAYPQGPVWFNPDSTPALARGGSGDVLTGLMAGLMAQVALKPDPQAALAAMVRTAVWWHAQAGIHAAQNCTELGVDAVTLAQALVPALTAG